MTSYEVHTISFQIFFVWALVPFEVISSGFNVQSGTRGNGNEEVLCIPQSFRSGLIWSGLVWFYGITTIVGYLLPNPLYTYILNIRGSLNKFPDFFRMGTFIDSTHMNL